MLGVTSSFDHFQTLPKKEFFVHHSTYDNDALPSFLRSRSYSLATTVLLNRQCYFLKLANIQMLSLLTKGQCRGQRMTMYVMTTKKKVKNSRASQCHSVRRQRIISTKRKDQIGYCICYDLVSYSPNPEWVTMFINVYFDLPWCFS